MYIFEPTKTTALKKKLLTLLSVCMVSICFGQVNLNVGLRAYYPFSGNASDVSGNNNNPVFNNAVLTADRAGNPNSAYHFNGSSSYMKVLNSPTINFVNKMSIALWVKPTGFYTGTCYNNMMVIKGDMDYLPEYYFMRFSDVYTGCTAPTTTQERFYSTGTIAATPIIQLNRWYSVVWTYDGTSSKLYVDCELKQDTYIPGLGFTNAYDLYIGHLNNAAFPYWLNGDLDEIRLYDRVLNQDEVNVLGGCSVVPTTTVNDYTAVTALNPCTNELLVEDASKYNAGDTVVLMQMKGADFDSTNTAAFGTVSDYKNAGNYEFNYIKSKSGNTLELTNMLTRQYDPVKGKVQLIRVPYFQDYTVTNPLTAAPWDGKKGGVLILNVQNTITLNDNIDVRGKGFAGATGVNTNRAAPPCSENNFFYSSASGDLASRKGEGLITVSDGKIFGKGPLANGGGSGNSYNSGGGGGGNAGAGGFGGFQSESCPGALDNRGIGGNAIPYSNAANKIFLGGGGGSGHTNNAEGFLSNGATGAGIAIIICNQLTANNKSIQAKGDDALTCGLPGNGCHEAMGGGGAGGTVLLKTNILTGNLTINTSGGAGANMLIPSSGRLGPGGGGGAGVTWLSNASLPASITIQNTAGPNGTCTGYSNAAWGATAGGTGTSLFNLLIPASTILFKKNIDSVRFNETSTNCTAFSFAGLAYVQSTPITNWYWDFGDGNTATTQNASNNYATGGTYIVKLVVTDLNGCKDSITKTIEACIITTPFSCNNFLRTGATGDAVAVGDLDITGNQVTVEALFYRPASLPFTPEYGKIVSKHTNASDVNYSLMAVAGEITTSTGYKVVTTPPDCSTPKDKLYHVAMVYDGATLKFYRNGFLINSVPATGTLVNNNLMTTISNGPQLLPTYQSLGFTNEVRIWNVARTQAEIRANMQTSLVNPTGLAGLKGYWVFDDLLNKQGNPAFNGTLLGGANINATVPNCNFLIDSCSAAVPPPTGPGVVINDYTPVTGFNICTNSLTVEDGTAYNTGDTVLVIQMKGAEIDVTNTATFGSVTDYKSAGNYEFNYVKSRTGNVIELENILLRSYDIPNGKVQLVRVPYYTNYTVAQPLTCLPWDGSKGGVLVLNARDTVTMNENIDVSGMGFKGGAGYNPGTLVLNCFQNGFNYPANTIVAGLKGESIATLTAGIVAGKGNPAGGGGGGLGHNSGGAGGGNGGQGGFGGYQLNHCGGAPFDNRGIGGRQLAYSSAANRIFLGSGGGAGHADNPGNVAPSGGNGGGIIIIKADKIQSNSNRIISNGANATICVLPGSVDCHDAMGGGGSGGTVLLSVDQYIDNAIAENKGGRGADVMGSLPAGGKIGPGGGGGGGIAFLKSAGVPAALTITNTGGINGVMATAVNEPWGATAGAAGSNLFNLVIPVATIPFKKNIDSVRFNNTAVSCTAFDFFGLAYTNLSGITNWAWDFGDGHTASTQNASNNYATGGTYSVKLIATDMNGCKDSITKTVNAGDAIANAGTDTAYCSNGTVTHTLHANTGGTGYSWTPAAVLSNPSSADPVATITATTRFYLTVTGSAGCEAKDSVDITVNPLPIVQTLPDTSFCLGSQLVLTTTPGLASYQWMPFIYVSNPAISNPVFTGTSPHTLTVTGTDVNGCKSSAIVSVGIRPAPVVETIEDSLICSNQNITLTTTGASTYTWSPATNLSNPNISNPVFSGTTGQTYTVTGTASNGCSASDVVTITVNPPLDFKQPPAKGMCTGQSVMLDGNNGTSVDYQWSPATFLSNTTISNPVANPPVTTVYQLLVTDRTCAQDSSFNVVVNVSQPPVIGLRKSGDIDCVNRAVSLNATGGVNYAWSPSTGLNNPNIPNPVASAPADQTYTVTVSNALNCSSQASITVYNKKAASLARYMPSAFTPDGNGINDCYRLKDWLYITKLEFYIYNRWGEPVFFTTRPNACWDGNYKGKKAEAGTYVYYIKAQTECGLEEQRGSVVLIR